MSAFACRCCNEFPCAVETAIKEQQMTTESKQPTVEELVREAREMSSKETKAPLLLIMAHQRTLLTQLADVVEQQRKQLLDVLTADVDGTAVGLLKRLQTERDATREQLKQAQAELVLLKTRSITLNANYDKLQAEVERREWFAEEIRIRAMQTGWMEHLTDALHAAMNRESISAPKSAEGGDVCEGGVYGDYLVCRKCGRFINDH